MNNYGYLLFFMVSILLVSCKKSSSVSESVPTLNEILPLKIGNHWEYIDSVFHPKDSVTVIQYSLSVISKQNILSGTDTVEVFVVRTTNTSGLINEYYYLNSSTGLYQYSQNEFDPTGQYSLRSLLIKYPMSQGDTWSTNRGDYYVQQKCISTDTVIVNAFSSFHCYKVRMGSYSPWYSDQYYSVGVGLVGGLSTDTGIPNPVYTKSTLVSFFVQ